MDPRAQFCHNPHCTARGQVGQGNITILSRKERRYRCRARGQTFTATKGTPFYRLHKAADVVTLVLTLLCHGCPMQAIVAAFGFDERTVANWQARAGQHCQRLHEHLAQQGQVDLRHVQAGELWVKMVGKRVWIRLWLGSERERNESVGRSARVAIGRRSASSRGWRVPAPAAWAFWSALMAWPAT